MRCVIGLLSLWVALGWCGTASAHGAFLVNTTTDVDDGSCDAPPDGDCSLREAMMAANALPNDHPDAPDTIAFDFGPGVEAPFRIELTSPLPPVHEGLMLNGGSEPRFILAREHAPVIIIDAGGLDHALELQSNNTLIIALGFTNASISAIDAQGADYLLIQGCYFGVDPMTGGAMPAGAPAFGSHAVRIRDTFRARIGGQGDLARNVFAGAEAEAIFAERSDSLLVHGNYVGVDPSGELARPNSIGADSAFSISVKASGQVEIWNNVVAANGGGGLQLIDAPEASIQSNVIGLDASGRFALGNAGAGIAIAGGIPGLQILDNVISANAGSGVTCLTGASGPWGMERNTIGVDIAQSEIAPNAGHGVYIETACQGATVGAATPNDGNLIAHNEGAGVRVEDGNAAIRGNAIFLNAGPAIDVGAPGRSDNAPARPSPPVNYPDGAERWSEEGALTIRACVAPGADVEIYEAIVSADGEVGALRFLGQGREGDTEDDEPASGCSASNEALFELSLSDVGEVGPVVLTATLQGHTSELSDAVASMTVEAPSDPCVADADCAEGRLLCDPVFRHCVLCVDDASGNDADTGCALTSPLCVGSPAERSCAEAVERPAEPRSLEPRATHSGCTVGPSGEPASVVWICTLIGWAVLRRRR